MVHFSSFFLTVNSYCLQVMESEIEAEIGSTGKKSKYNRNWKEQGLCRVVGSRQILFQDGSTNPAVAVEGGVALGTSVGGLPGRGAGVGHSAFPCGALCAFEHLLLHTSGFLT